MTTTDSSRRQYRVVVLRGDGIGPEVVAAALTVLEAVAADGGFVLDLHEAEAGAACYERTGRAMSDGTFAACRDADAVLKGPVGLPGVRASDGTEAGLLGGILRRGLDLYANLRPVRLYPGVHSALAGRDAGSIDYAIVRENTEGLYISRGLGVATDQAVADTLLVTRLGCERIARFAFDLARSRRGAPADGVHRVTCVDKSNVLRSLAFFRKIFYEVGEQYPDIEKDVLYVDAAAQALVLDPGHFDVLVCENFIGDILSDLGGATVGGLGFCPSANIGEAGAYFEPIHGSAPTLTGQDRANPIATILSCALLLEHLGEQGAAFRLREAAERCLRERRIVPAADGMILSGTRAAGEAIAALIRSV
ncbi:MAG: isocitrate/isopropylmalate dehydrogenase family protein [Dehalococcoidia bacterium]